MNKARFEFPTADTVLSTLLVVGLALVGGLTIVAIATQAVVA